MLKKGDRVICTNNENQTYYFTVGLIYDLEEDEGMQYTLKDDKGWKWQIDKNRFEPLISSTKTLNQEVKTMELKDIKKVNLKEAKKQYNEEKKNAEIVFAKERLSYAINMVDEFDRRIKALEEEKEPFQEVIDSFNN